MARQIPAPELFERYEQLYTGIVTDVLDGYGYEDQTLDREVQPLTREMATAGAAFPALGRANRSVDPDEQIRSFLEMLGDVPAHSVLVMDTHDTGSSHMGELTTTALQNADCRGAVVDGGTRDSEFIIEQSFPVFTRFQTPADSVPRWELVDWDTEVVVGGVAVEPGDVVVGDIDGVAVVPRDVATDVLIDAEEMVNTEDEVRAAITEGRSPLDAYEEYGTF